MPRHPTSRAEIINNVFLNTHCRSPSPRKLLVPLTADASFFTVNLWSHKEIDFNSHVHSTQQHPEAAHRSSRRSSRKQHPSP
ncbi:hypothetical protein SNOG_03886 [Parastagonospora nodorum SN15]|uniref:Uncharacterized protein n=1 Tax=Phaeosphaeria nodorum (strain SN15 / ATCC MYA-4574 / FGSC 10173) TaxID=321614 RepID=Q0UWH8_PHANO|nr:hypothetical protein SNOG_03886 [Parastagonospora nodorum SN15]EAT89091.1 hypothetical protein SNOG_03886 [Parastagonospora nodorum SN15]